jgi:hypothetical protein
MVPQNCQNLWSRMNRIIIQKQNRWFTCEFQICSEPLNERDQHTCYILLKKCCIDMCLLPVFRTMSMPIRNHLIVSVSMTSSLTWEETTNGVKDSPAADTQHITDACLRLRCTPWRIVWSVIETGTITFRGARPSHLEIPTSSRLNTNSTQEPGRCSLRHAIIVSKNDRGILSVTMSYDPHNAQGEYWNISANSLVEFLEM